MRLTCELEVRSQISPSSAKKACACTLAFCKDKNGNPILLACTKKNVAGQKYEVKNIKKVFSKFSTQGIASLSFSSPPHDLFIKKADPLQLRSFLHFLTTNDKSALHFSAPPTRIEAPAPKKMTILRRGDLPSSFPKLLESLTVTGLGLLKVLSSFHSLKNLTSLDLSANALESLPEAPCGATGLRRLSLANNQLRNVDGISGLVSLQYLDISSNKMTILPDTVCDLQNLLELNIENNLLTCLPQGIGRLKRLKSLKAATNKIEVLPSSFTGLCGSLETLDLFMNPLNRQITSPFVSAPVLPSLLHWAAQCVLQARLPVSPECLPGSLLAFLKSQNNFCLVCTRPVCVSSLPAVDNIDLKQMVQTVTAVNMMGRTQVPIQVTMCFTHAQKSVRKRKQSN